MYLRVIKEVMCTELGAFLSVWRVTQRSRKTHGPASRRQEDRTEAGVGGKKMTKSNLFCFSSCLWNQKNYRISLLVSVDTFS